MTAAAAAAAGIARFCAVQRFSSNVPVAAAVVRRMRQTRSEAPEAPEATPPQRRTSMRMSRGIKVAGARMQRVRQAVLVKEATPVRMARAVEAAEDAVLALTARLAQQIPAASAA